ncbi:MAG: GTPase [Candidatus Anstonellaceae archaeon]
MRVERIKRLLEKSQILIEVVDARMIEKCRLREIEKKYQNKVVVVATKVDLIDEETKKEEGIFFVDNKTKEGIKELKDKILQIGIEKLKKYSGPINVFVFGLPNVGKSSLINALSGRKVAKTGFRAGITKGLQWIKLSDRIMLIDSPGVIDKKIEKDILGLTASIDAQKIQNPTKLANRIIEMFFKKNKLEKLFSFFKISPDTKKGKVIEAIAKRRGFYMKGGKLNIEEASRVIIREWQKGRLKI